MEADPDGLFQVDVIPKGSVVFISQPLPHINVVYGGLMSLRAQMIGAQGVIIDGRLRDLQEHRDLGFPVSHPLSRSKKNSLDPVP